MAREWSKLAPFFSRHSHRTIIFLFNATLTCATFFSSHQWRCGSKSGASAHHWQFYLRVTHHRIVCSIFYFYFTFRLDSGVLIKKKTQDEGATLTLLSGLRTQVPAAAFFVLHKICIFMLHSQKMLPFKKLNKLSEHAGQGAFLVIQGPRVQAPPAAHVC